MQTFQPEVCDSWLLAFIILIPLQLSCLVVKHSYLICGRIVKCARASLKNYISIKKIVQMHEFNLITILKLHW